MHSAAERLNEGMTWGRGMLRPDRQIIGNHPGRRMRRLYFVNNSTYLYPDPVLKMTTRSEGARKPSRLNFRAPATPAAPSGQRKIPSSAATRLISDRSSAS